MPDQLMEWLKQPFSPDMSVLRWFMFLGLVAVLLWAWHQIFREIHMVEGEVA